MSLMRNLLLFYLINKKHLLLFRLDSKYWPWRLPREYIRPSNPHHWMIDRCDAYIKPSVSRYYRPYRPLELTSYYYG